MNQQTICNVCAANEWKHHLTVKSEVSDKLYELRRCLECGLVQVADMPTENEIREIYKDNCGPQNRNKENLFRGADAIRINCAPIEDSDFRLRKIEKLSPLPSNATLLDVGAGCGFFLYAAKLRGYRVHGIDLDQDAISFAQSALGIDIKYQTIHEAASCGNQFDLVTACGMYEHLTDPGDTLFSITSMMKSGGLFAGYVPNVGGWFARLMGTKWYHYIPPQHLLYFDTGSLRNLLESRGLEVLYMGPCVLDAAPTFGLGIRPFVRRLPLPSSFIHVICQVVKWVKRWIVYRPISATIMLFGRGGNNIFFCARKP